MMLGGVGFQAGVDAARREQHAAQPVRDMIGQIKELKALHDQGVLSPEEFRLAKAKLLED